MKWQKVIVLTLRLFLSADICAVAVDARHTPAGFELGLHQFRHHHNRKTLRHPIELIRADRIQLRNRKRHYRDIRQLFGQLASDSRVDWNW